MKKSVMEKNAMNIIRTNKANRVSMRTQIHDNERGSATVIALLVMGLLTVFVSLALSRASSEAMLMNNDASEGRAFNAAQASLETMTRNFNKIYDVRLSPLASDLTHIQTAAVPGFTSFGFNQLITPTAAPTQVVISGGSFQGLYATRDAWRLDTTATETSSGVQVQLTREFYNNLVPIFQFGIFYDDNMEFHPGPKFAFGGRVHSNASIFLMAGTELTFDSRVTAVNQIVTEVARNGSPWTNWDEKVYVKNASGTPIQLKHDMGSVRNGPDIVPNDPDMPDGIRNPAWNTIRSLFDGNLQSEVKALRLPIKGVDDEDYIELVRRGKDVGSLYKDALGATVPVTAGTADVALLSKERYTNKTGIRISLADSKAKLPGCASGVGTNAIPGPCGVRLDGAALKPALNTPWLDANVDGSEGYQPLPMGAYVATRLNGNRLDQSNGRQNWIKVEIVSVNVATGLPQAQDVTEEFLALGVTEQPARITVGGVTKFEIDPLVYNHTALVGTDSRSVIKLQRFLMPGPDVKAGVASNFLSFYNWTTDYNLVVTNTGVAIPGPVVDGGFADSTVHKKKARVDSAVLDKWVVPFPIEMFDTREGLYNDDLDVATVYPNGVVPRNGVMSMIDIDVANLRRVLAGAFDGQFPATTTYAVANGGVAFRSTNVPSANGWVLYVSDRRGDRDFDGEYDMEDIYGNNDGLLQSGENVNFNKNAMGLGILDVDLTWQECPRYSEVDGPDVASVLDHKYYRRGVRLINGTVLPGTLDLATPGNTLGFSVAAENAIYVKGNYNATGVSEYNDPTSPKKYIPFDDPVQIPASIVGDAVIILSNNWNDGKSFRYPFALGSRVATETTVRAAILAGDAMSSLNAAPNQGGGDTRLNGGVHNFKRFLENWGGIYLNYCGSLINLFNARNNTGAFKCCIKVYSPPIRNWIYDTSFLDPSRLPPGTPAFQFVQVTGFQRVNF